MDPQQFQQFMEKQNEQQQQINQLISAIVSLQASQSRDIPNASANTSNKDIIKNFKCEKFDPNNNAETFIDFFEAQCRLWGLHNDTDAQTNKTKCQLFFTCLKPESYKELKTAFANSETKFEEQQYQAVIKKFLDIFHIKTTRFKALTDFWNCTRVKNQTFENYAIKLKDIAQNCGYSGEMLDRQLRDRFATGLNHKRLEIEMKQKWPDLKQLVNGEEKEITFAQVFEIAQAREMAEKDYDDMNDNTIGKVEKPNNNKTAQNSCTTLTPQQCKRCGLEQHKKQICQAINSKCRSCGIVGHFERVCLKSGNARTSKQYTKNNTGVEEKPKRKQQVVHKMEEVTDGSDSSNFDEKETDRGVFRTGSEVSSKKINVEINNVKCTMDWDPGASYSIISYEMWKKIGKPHLSTAPVLKAYGGFVLHALGLTHVSVRWNRIQKYLSVVVIKHAKPMLFGLPWCEAFHMEFPEGVYSLKHANGRSDINQQLKQLINEYKQLFEDTLGKVVDYKIKLHIKKDAKPVHAPARPIKFGIKKNVEAELDRLVSQGIITELDPNETPIEWATPTVNVPKKNGGIRICGDFRTTINPNLIAESYPVPLFDQLRRQLANGKSFSKIDLKDAYLQFEVDEESRKYVVISTHKGYFAYNRLPFGISNAPAIFGRYIEKLIHGIPYTATYFDDIAVTGSNDEEHLQNLAEVFRRLQQAGLKVQLEKCSFLQDSIEYLGHTIDKTGVHPSNTKVKAIQNASPPTNIKELKSFLGLVNFYERFIPNLHGICSDLHTLTSNKQQWKWGSHEQKIFENIKQLVSNPRTLVPFDENRPLYLACDASEKGVGAVLFHMNQGNMEQPIAFASRKLDQSEQRYSVIDREALALFYGIKKFDQYLRGTHFTLITDHKPLQHLFGEKRSLPKIVNNRLVRWALYVGTYSYDIIYRQGKHNLLADCLSRLPDVVEKTSKLENYLKKVYTVIAGEKMSDILLSEHEIKKHTNRDRILHKVKQYLITGWAGELSEEFKPYYGKREELSIENGIIMHEGKIVVPASLQQHILNILHEGHPGINAMRALSRYYVWWPHIDSAIDQYIKSCNECQRNRQSETQLPIFSWSIPERVWERIHIDFAGPFEDSYWLIVVDALSKWADVIQLTKITTKTLTHALDNLFVKFGLPEIIVSDNGRQMTSEDFKQYCLKKSIKHITVSPYHPKGNGLAERFVRTFKDRMKASRNSSQNQASRLNNFLFSYRNTPHNTTLKSPNEAMFGRRLRTLLDNIKPNIREKLRHTIVQQELNNTKYREFKEGDDVFIKTDLEKEWKPAVVKEKRNKYSYIVISTDGVERRRHADHIRKRHDQQPLQYEELEWNLESPSLANQRINTPDSKKNNSATLQTQLFPSEEVVVGTTDDNKDKTESKTTEMESNGTSNANDPANDPVPVQTERRNIPDVETTLRRSTRSRQVPRRLLDYHY